MYFFNLEVKEEKEKPETKQKKTSSWRETLENGTIWRSTNPDLRFFPLTTLWWNTRHWINTLPCSFYLRWWNKMLPVHAWSTERWDVWTAHHHDNLPVTLRFLCEFFGQDENARRRWGVICSHDVRVNSHLWPDPTSDLRRGQRYRHCYPVLAELLSARPLQRWVHNPEPYSCGPHYWGGDDPRCNKAATIDHGAHTGTPLPVSLCIPETQPKKKAKTLNQKAVDTVHIVATSHTKRFHVLNRMWSDGCD